MSTTHAPARHPPAPPAPPARPAPRRPARSPGPLAALGALLLVVLSACTSVPGRDLSDFIAALREARAEHERLMLEAFALDERLRDGAGPSAPADEAPGQGRAWSATGALEDARTPDRVLVRAAAWDVLERYALALSALADGSRAEQTGARFDALRGSLERFPFDQLGEEVARAAASLGAAVGPGLELVRVLIRQGAAESDRRGFIEAARRTLPAVRLAVALFLADTDAFSAYHRLDHQRRAQALADHAGRVLDALVRLSTRSAAPQGADRDVLEDLLAQARRIHPDLDADTRAALAWAREPAFPESAADELQRLRDELRRTGDRVEASRRALRAYEGVLTVAVRLLVRLDGAAVRLQESVEHPSRALPPAEDLRALVVALRLAVARQQLERTP
jgi:hypothetical protein